MTRVDEITVYGRSFRTLFIGGFARLTDQDFHAAVDAARDYLARREALECYRVHAHFDYRATTADPRAAGDCQPSFEVCKIPALEGMYRAILDNDRQLFDAVCRAAGASEFPWDTYALEVTDTTADVPTIEAFLRWIRSFPRAVLEAARGSFSALLDDARALAKRSAATQGASSVTHAYYVMSAVMDDYARRFEEGLSKALAATRRKG